MRLCHPHLMDNIGASLEETYDGNLNYEAINDEGNVSVLKGTSIIMPDPKCRLLIPQDNFMNSQRLNNPEGTFKVTWGKSVLKISDKVPINTQYEHTTHLTVLNAYNRIFRTAESLDITGCVTSEKN